jgi:hypothetical protein
MHLKVDTEKTIRARVEKKLKLEPGGIKSDKNLKAAFKQAVAFHLGHRDDTCPRSIFAYTVCTLGLNVHVRAAPVSPNESFYHTFK